MGRRVIAALGLGVLVLSGCGAMDAGEAAVSDEFRISQADVDTEVRLVLEALGQPPAQPPEGLAAATTQRLVQDALFIAKAEELGVQVTQGQIETGLAELAAQNGGQEALEQAALQAGIAPESLDDFVRTGLLIREIGVKLDSAADATAQSELARAELVAYSEDIDVRVAPRYGTWDDAQLGIVPGSSVARPPVETVEP
jgi:hypothetical protein